MLAVDPSMFADVQGSTDTEVVFHLALTLGLEDGPIEALERTVGMIEAIARRHGVADAVQASFGVSDGTSLWAVRYATTGRPRSLFASAEADAIRRLHPDNPRFQRLSHDDRLIVSEPFSDLPGVWQKIPEATAVTVRRGGVLGSRPFLRASPRGDHPPALRAVRRTRSRRPNDGRRRVGTCRGSAASSNRPVALDRLPGAEQAPPAGRHGMQVRRVWAAQAAVERDQLLERAAPSAAGS